MTAVAFWITGVSIVSFMLALLLTSFERKQGSRLLFSRIRDRLDTCVSNVYRKLKAAEVYVIRHVITLSWYYSIHSFLKFILQFLGYTYNRIESVLLKNREKARQIRREKRLSSRNHLTAIAEHKAETTLSPQEQKKLKDKTLQGRH